VPGRRTNATDPADPKKRYVMIGMIRIATMFAT